VYSASRWLMPCEKPFWRSKFGLLLSQRIAHITTKLPSVIEGSTSELPVSVRQIIERLIEHFKVLDTGLGSLKRKSRFGAGQRDQPSIRVCLKSRFG